MKTLVSCSCGAPASAVLHNGVSQVDPDGHAPYCTFSIYESDTKMWTIRLNEYQRNNLAWVFGLIGYPKWDQAIEPFNLLNTGDWAGEIPWLLVRPNQELAESQDSANTKRVAMKQYVHAWVIGELQKIAKPDDPDTH